MLDGLKGWLDDWRRVSFRRPRPPREWNQEELQRQFIACYFAVEKTFANQDRPMVYNAAVVYRQDRQRLPAKLARQAARDYPEGFSDFVTFTFRRTRADDASIQEGWESFGSETDACAHGRAFVGPLGTDVPFTALPFEITLRADNLVRWFPGVDS
jgi:hypothetical protein